ncbi:carbohydrate ABC transporter permease [Paenibacillus aurantius]|uniref:Carbohydrate ABC transporter permease n=1 Tax=Paenibacillus aurantius TaxID=2918900 RepID=A0AA96L9F3_9BACL|nr:carbohydrate ABC transporter permease [Paenibacillus aurantius]WNQ09457.1 carbohydrate ABC transporter permease [Paenibacillus aurantius]
MGETRGDRAFDIVNILFLCIITVLVIYPLLFVLSASISNPAKVFAGELWLWPKEITFDGYKRIFANKDIMTGYGNTILYTFVGTAVNVVLTICAAYPMSRKDLKGRNVLTVLIVFTMFFTGGLIPTYLIVKDLGLLDSIWAMILPNAIAVYNVIIMRTYFQTSIPSEMQEAASIDGCDNFRILTRVVLPLSMPILAVMVLFYSVAHWNAFFNALIYLSDRTKFPLQLILREILIQGQTQDMVDMNDDTLMRKMMEAESIKYGVVVVANLPVLMLYPFLQRYFVKGMMIGALKG